MRRLIFGCGYLGSRVARLWQESGDEVHVVTRRAERAGELERAGWQPIVADVSAPETLRGLPAADSVLFAVGYDRASGATIEQVYVEGLRHVLDALGEAPRRIIYISSTGVYGQQGGAWVDESSPCEPLTAGGRASLAAERVLAAHELSARGTALRMAGLYGPGRIPRSADLLAGRAIDAPADGYLNLIHIDDAARIVVEVSAAPAAESCYVVSDGAPCLRREYYEELARQLGAPALVFAPNDEPTPARDRAASDKRVNPARLRALLRGPLLHPSYREGLAAILAK